MGVTASTLRGCALVPLAGFALACGDGPTAPVRTGSYQLSTVNGQPLPTDLSPVAGAIVLRQVTTGSLVLGGDGQYDLEIRCWATQTSDGAVVSVALAWDGAYQASGNTATIDFAGDIGERTATFSGSTVSITLGVGPFGAIVFAKDNG